MAFLDNSGDIILDAVLTDAGRKRMAEGRFNITKYAFSDEEINYGLFNSNHPSGSAFYDLEIMQTPILEAFTNNTSTMASKLMSLTDNNFLYLPVMKLNEVWGKPAPAGGPGASTNHSGASFSARVASGGTNSSDHQGKFLITVDAATEELYKQSNAGAPDTYTTDDKYYTPGVILGAESNTALDLTFICIDQGIESTQENGLSIVTPFPEELRETAYMIRMDHRLGRLARAPGAMRTLSKVGGDPNAPNADWSAIAMGGGQAQFAQANLPNANGRASLPYAFVDDDNIASYYITTANSGMILSDIKASHGPVISDQYLNSNNSDKVTGAWFERQVFQYGPVGSRLIFTVRSQDTVKLSYDLFDTSRTKKLNRNAAESVAGEVTFKIANDAAASNQMTVNYIDSVITVTGVTTGYSIDIPVRYVKKTAS